MSQTTIPPSEFISAAEARRILGLTPHQLSRLKSKGRLCVREVPHTQPTYLRSDVERLSREAVKPATTAVA
jgi:hypothetical protein